MTQCRYILFCRPRLDGLGRRELGTIYVDDRGVGCAERVRLLIGRGVDLLGQGQPLPIGFGQTDDFLKPGGAGGLEMQPRTRFLERPIDGLIDRKLVRTGVDTEFQIGGQAKFPVSMPTPRCPRETRV